MSLRASSLPLRPFALRSRKPRAPGVAPSLRSGRHNAGALGFLLRVVTSNQRLTIIYTSRPFREPITVALHMSVITQDGDSALMIAAGNGWTEVVALLVKAGANTDLQNKVSCMSGYGSSTVLLWGVHHNLVMV